MSLLEQAQNLPQGKILDVSNMDVETGYGARHVETPRTDYDPNGKFWLIDPPFLSNSLSHYIAACQLLFGNQGLVTYSDNIILACLKFYQNRHVKVVPMSKGLSPQLPTLVLPRSPTLSLPLPPLSPLRSPTLPRPLSPLSPLRSPTLPRPLSPTLSPILPTLSLPLPPLSPLRSPTLSSSFVLPQVAPPLSSQLSPPRSPQQPRARLSLGDRVNNLPYGKVLDVSHMTDVNGTGTRVIEMPRTNRGGKHGIDGIPIVSNNLNNYIMAFRVVYGPGAEQQYQNELNILRAKFA